MSAANDSHPACSQPSCHHRTGTIILWVLGEPHWTCARCAGSVIYRVAAEYGALVEIAGTDSFENRRRRERQLAVRRAA